MQYDHHGTRIDGAATPDRAPDVLDAIRALDGLIYDAAAHFATADPGDQYRSDIAAACHDYLDYLAAYYHATGDSWHAADELAYTHDRATHLGKRPG